MRFYLMVFNFLIALLVLFVNLFRQLRSVFKTYSPFGDGASYLFLADFLRTHRVGEFDSRAAIGVEPVAEGGVYFYYINLLFPRRFLLAFPYIPNLCLLFITFAVTPSILWFAYSNNIASLGYVNSILAASISLLFVPFFWLNNYNISLYNIQPRSLGIAFGSLIYTLLFISVGDTSYPYQHFILSAGAGILTYFFIDISVFSRQVFLLALLPVSLSTLNIYTITSMLLAVIIRSTSAAFRSKIRAQYLYVIQYWCYGRSSLMSYRKISTRFSILNRTLNLFKSIFSASILDLAAYIPLILITSFCLLQRENSSIPLFIVVWPILIAVLTTFRIFSSIGEGWRYIAFTSVPLYVYFALISISNLSIFLLLPVFLFMALLYTVKPLDIENDNESILRLCSHAYDLNHMKSLKLYCLPNRLGTVGVNLGYADYSTEYQAGNVSKDLMDKYFTLIPSKVRNLPAFSPTWPERYQFTHILYTSVALSDWLEANSQVIQARGLSIEHLLSIGNYSIGLIFYN